MSDDKYPSWVCTPCGIKYGKGGGNGISTFHNGTCGICGSDAAVTEPRDFGHLRDGWQSDQQKLKRVIEEDIGDERTMSGM